MAGWGDPAFDVGSALSDYAAFALRVGPSAAPASLWRGYVRARGLDERAAAALLERSVRFAGARLVQSAYEHTQETTVMSPRVTRVVALARELLLGPVATGAARLGIDR